MKMVAKIVLGILLFLIIITNAFPILSTWRWYDFTTKDGAYSFELYEAKGRDLDMMERSWNRYKDKYKPIDTTLYRTFKIKPFAFWHWRQYLFSRKYSYPYLDPKNIEKAQLKVDNVQLQDLPDSFLLVSAGQMSPFNTIVINNITFQLVKDFHGDTTYIGTRDTSFITPEGYKVGMILQQIKMVYRNKLYKEPGWGFHAELPSKWSLLFAIGNTATDHPPTDTSRVTCIFKRS